MDVSKNIDLKTELCLLFIMLILQFSLSSYSESYSCQHDLGVHCISKKDNSLKLFAYQNCRVGAKLKYCFLI